MKKVLSFIIALVISVLSVGNIAYASVENSNSLKEKLDQYTIQEVLDYAESVGIEYTITDYDEIDKAEIVDAVVALTSTPEIIEEKYNTVAQPMKLSNKGEIGLFALPDSYQSNVKSVKKYTTAFNNKYTCSIDVTFVYNLYTNGGTKYIDKIVAYSSRLSTYDINTATYTQHDIYVDTDNSNSTKVLIKGHGTYVLNLAGVNFDKDINFSMWFYAGDR